MCTCAVKLQFPYKVNAPPKGHAAGAGFHTDRGGGGLEFPPPPQEILLNNNLVPDFVRSNLRDPNSTFSWRGGMPPDPPSRHAHLHVREHAFARLHMRKHAFAHDYHPATILFFIPNSKSCMKPCGVNPPS